MLPRLQVSSTSKAAPVAVLTPECEGSILDPCTSTQQMCIGGVVSVDCIATTGKQASVGTSIAGIVPSEAAATLDMSSNDNLDTTSAPTDNLIVTQAPCHHSSASMDVSMAAQCASASCSFDASDRPDYAADVAEALARLCKRASEDGQGQSANQAVTDCQQQHMQTAAEITFNPPTALVSSEVQHAAVDQVLEELLDEVSAPVQPVQSSMPADSAADIVSDDFAAVVVALVSSQVQHAAVDQVVDDLLDEVAAPLQAVQSSIPADTSGMVSPIFNPRISLPAKASEGPVEDLNSGCSESAEDADETISADLMVMADTMMTSEVQHAAVDQVLDDLLDEVSAPLQAVQSSMPSDISGRVSPMVSPRVSLSANLFAPQHAAVDQVLDELLAKVSPPLLAVQSSMPADTTGRVSPIDSLRVSLLANSSAPQQAVGLPAVPAPDSCYVSSTTHSTPVATAAKRSSAELMPLVPPSSSTGKENGPVVEARHVSKEVKQVVGAMGRGRGRVCCLDRSSFQEMAQALPTEPSSQVMHLTMMPLPQR